MTVGSTENMPFQIFELSIDTEQKLFLTPGFKFSLTVGGCVYATIPEKYIKKKCHQSLEASSFHILGVAEVYFVVVVKLVLFSALYLICFIVTGSCPGNYVSGQLTNIIAQINIFLK
ncbi:Hypothetical predicted protein [Podarcis lilfordi]|uniref:Uncharacterized protein n=1 Tax=Podarcis lilfordi TaxID=74358 RepID=A0AA35JY59_9SAUR|nr:Hypothetical predicted protein [Podarcis lilfordi]